MKRLFAAAAFAPLALAAHGAYAQTTVSTATTAPVSTSTTGDLTVDGNGSITVPDNAAITVDSDNKVVINGTVNVRNSAAGIGVQVNTPAGGRTSAIAVGGNILATDDAANGDLDKDGDLDGIFVNSGVVRYGVRVQGAGPFIGDITQSGGQINVEGNDGSAAISVETGLTGNLTAHGGIAVLGSNSYGVHVTGPVTGNVSVGSITGAVLSAQGENAVGVALDGDVGGAVKIDGAIRSTGFRYLTRTELIPPVKLENLDADDLLIGGAAVRIAGSVGKGVVVDAPPSDLDTDNDDEDGDGVGDANETTGIVTSIGSAPGLQIAGPNAITLGNVGTGSDAYGLIIRGQIIGTGLFDGITGLAVQVGDGTGAVDTGGGIRIQGTVSGSANKADATGLWLHSGVSTPAIVVDRGTLTGGADALDGGSVTAKALVIDAGAQTGTLTNSGAIRAGVTGDAGNAVAVQDSSGTLGQITNSGAITAQVQSRTQDLVPTGERIALDLRANTTGVNLSQVANSIEGVVPTIQGDILLSAGAQNDTVSFQAGGTSGAIDFGGGDDVFSVGKDVTSIADVSKASGNFVVSTAGALTFANSDQVNLTSLDVADTGVLTFTADPANSDPTQHATLLNVSGSATFNAGSKIALNFKSKPPPQTTLTLLQAGNLVDNGLDASLLEAIPMILTGQVSTSGNQIQIAVRRREAAELGLFGGRAQAYDAFYAAFDQDPAVANVVFSKTTQASFDKLYNQFLPDYSGGPFNSLAHGARAVMQAQSEEPLGFVSGEPRSWLQEVGLGTRQESVNDIPYQSAGLGFAGGYEKPLGDHAAYGFSAAFLSAEVRNAQRSLGSLLTANTLMSSVYWRGQEGPLLFDASLSGGYAWFKSTRRIVDQTAEGAQTLIRDPRADWNGALASARLGVAYDWTAGPFYVRHDAVLDAVYLNEQAYSETGGGAATNLHVGQRTNYEAAAEVGVLLGASFGRTFRWGPEVRVAYRELLGGGEGDTQGYFISVPGTPFSLPGLAKDRERIIVRAALRGQGAYANFALEASGDIGEIYQAYMARVLVRFLF